MVAREWVELIALFMMTIFAVWGWTRAFAFRRWWYEQRDFARLCVRANAALKARLITLGENEGPDLRAPLAGPDAAAEARGMLDMYREGMAQGLTWPPGRHAGGRTGASGGQRPGERA